MEIVEDVVIVGGGIAGLATAVALKTVGIRALVLEKSDGLRTTGAALTLSKNAWRALDALGVSHKLTSLYSPTLGYIHITTLQDRMFFIYFLDEFIFKSVFVCCKLSGVL